MSNPEEKIQVSKTLHNKAYKQYVKTVGVASLLRMTLLSLENGNTDSENIVQLLGDIQAVCEYMLNDISEVSDYLDNLHFFVMEVKEGSTPSENNNGGEQS